MPQAQSTSRSLSVPSPLMLADQMITLAKACDGAGLRACAGTLVGLACAVLEESPAH